MTTRLLAAIAGCASIAAAPDDTADRRFKALYTAEYAWRLTQEAPDEDRPQSSAHLPDVGPAAQAAKRARWAATLTTLDAIDPAALTAADRVDYAVYRGQIVALANEQRFRDYEKPLTADTSFWGDVADAARGRYPIA